MAAAIVGAANHRAVLALKAWEALASACLAAAMNRSVDGAVGRATNLVTLGACPFGIALAQTIHASSLAAAIDSTGATLHVRAGNAGVAPFAHTCAIAARTMVVAVIRAVWLITSLAHEPNVTLADTCLTHTVATAIIGAVSHLAIYAHPAALANAATALAAVTMATVARAKIFGAISAMERQVAEAAAALANPVAVAINVLAGGIDLCFHSHTHAARITSKAM